MTSNELITGINQKSEHVWKIFFNSYYDSLYRHAYRILKEEKVAEDVVQELFISLWDNHLQLESENVLSAYLYRSVTNRCLNQIRNQNREDERLMRWAIDTDDEASEVEFSSAVREEVLRRLQELIARLPEGRKKIMLLSMEGMSGEAIAHQLNISITTVKQQKYRAYSFLRAHLGEHWTIVMILYLS